MLFLCNEIFFVACTVPLLFKHTSYFHQYDSLAFLSISLCLVYHQYLKYSWKQEPSGPAFFLGLYVASN